MLGVGTDVAERSTRGPQHYHPKYDFSDVRLPNLINICSGPEPIILLPK